MTCSHHPAGQVVLVLGDQLSANMSSLRAANRQTDTVLIAEVAEEAGYVPHHKKKIAFLFSAMRHFAAELAEAGWRVRYVTLDHPDNAGTLCQELSRAVIDLSARSVLVTKPGEYRVMAALRDWSDSSGIDLKMLDDDRFITSPQAFRDWAKGRKQLRMADFYRDLRRKTGLLMQGDQPEGGQWSFDSENRKPAKADLFMPTPPRFAPDATTRAVLTLVETRFDRNFGMLQPFWFAVTRQDALTALAHFVDQALPQFGDYQDAMLDGQPFLYHSVLAQYMNAGLLDPMEVCRRVERAYYDERVPLNAAEGYIRQIIGWREYMRGIYWLRMPGYTEQNFFAANRALPGFYWTADTDMACMAATIRQTRDEAYAHHIQRLMITGNFALLAGIDPHQVHEWYLAVYADAYEWVEAPNVIGMSQYADGGFLGSKPYAASGNYINKMSDYCLGCRYDVKAKTGPQACPFNPLYWDFLVRNEDKLRGNPRLGPAYRTWDKLDDNKKKAYRESAQALLQRL